ncbi:MAG TPA: prepilin-type N-terminal cleavage/methylation domain-containing protein [Candidatus Saccharimonadales bacterium]
MHKRFHDIRSGFTIVELIVVVAIISAMASMSTIVYLQSQREARDSKRNADMDILAANLERFYQQKGEYPPGCPDTSCPSTMLTTNTSATVITPNTTLTTLTALLPTVKGNFGDPQSSNKTLPFKQRVVAESKYYYFGGTVNYTGATTTLSFASHANFPCTIQSSLTAGTVGSYVIGYYSEGTGQWVLLGGRNGTPMTVTAGQVSDGCVINKS